jgi:quercetin dioxygenase-like cupin family protein
MKIHSWSSIAQEELNPTASRQVIHSQRMTIARLTLKKGAIVEKHHHENEQVTILESGRLRFEFPDEVIELLGGQVLEIPSNVPHRVEALEDSRATDLFAPVREDWLRGDDAYLRGSAVR